jgi:KDO2-lipid IV(A) lauroyltransferase
MSEPIFQRAFYAPRHWPTWLALALARAICSLPVPWAVRVGEGIGVLVYALLRSRRKVVRANLRIASDGAEVLESQVKAHFRAAGRGLIEAGLAWWASDAKLKPCLKVTGLEHWQDGTGALLLTGHFTTLELGARALCLAGKPFHAMYRPLKNPLLDYYVHHWRQARSALPALPKEDLRGILKALRGGAKVWYAPDQTLGGNASALIPFFGRPVPTLTATAKLAQLGRCQVLPYFPRYQEGVWQVQILPPLLDFPSANEYDDALRVNQLIEVAARATPEQYFWLHRRFKPLKDGDDDPYHGH